MAFMERKCNATAQDWLQHQAGLEAENARALNEMAPELIRRMGTQGPALITIGGAPGTGKSTLTHWLTILIQEQYSLPVVSLSLDDYYHTQEQRLRLSQEIHPLLAQRGVPGTHDLSLLLHHLDQILGGTGGTIEVPRFEKGRDERAKQTRTLDLPHGPPLLLLEGWCLGTPPQSDHLLQQPINDLERLEDPNCQFRRYVNAELGRLHEALTERSTAAWFLKAPDWETVQAWRWKQEQSLITEALDGRLLRSPEEVRRFLDSFQRIAEHGLATVHQWAHTIINLDIHHHPTLEPAL